MTIRVLCIAGARPNFMKVAPLLRALDSRRAFRTKLVHTGQHYDTKLSQIFFEELGIRQPDISLEVGSGTHAAQTAEIMKRFEPVVAAEQPHVVLVVGDVNSTIACALVAAKCRLTESYSTRLGLRWRPLIVHVEAGLRSNDDDMPEELNRKLTDCISDVLYVSDPAGVENLAHEGVSPEKVVFVGNVMIDTLLAARERAMRSPILATLGLSGGDYGVVTLHRPSNVDDAESLRELLSVLDEVAREVRLVFPVHPRTRARMVAAGLTLDGTRWHLVDSVGYLDFVRLISCARVVLTDSGGVQEETTVLGVPCITLRENTERPVTIAEGTNQLSGTTRNAVLAALARALSGTTSGRIPRYWDGKAAERIVEHLDGVFGVSR